MNRFTDRARGTDTPLDDGLVVSSPSVDANDEPTILVEGSASGEPIRVRVPQRTASEQHIPPEGAVVYFLLLDERRGIYLATVGTDHGGYDESRVIDHPYSDTEIQMNADGSTTVSGDGPVTVNATGDVTIDANGSIYLNGIEWDTHDHSYSWGDSAGSGNTGGPQ